MQPLSREESRRVDALAQERFGLPGDLLMENAGGATARFALSRCSTASSRAMLVLCGPGNNGGDGFVAARHLLGSGEVEVHSLVDPQRLRGDARRNFERWSALGERTFVGTPIESLSSWLDSHPDGLVIDALFGIGLDRPMDGLAAEWARCLRSRARRVLAVDIPSGLDCDDGTILGEAVRATWTLSFVAPKLGFTRGRGPELCGEITIATIGFPAERDPRAT